jgi:hypothetical protein
MFGFEQTWAEAWLAPKPLVAPPTDTTVTVTATTTAAVGLTSSPCVSLVAPLSSSSIAGGVQGGSAISHVIPLRSAVPEFVPSTIGTVRWARLPRVDEVDEDEVCNRSCPPGSCGWVSEWVLLVSMPTIFTALVVHSTLWGAVAVVD